MYHPLLPCCGHKSILYTASLFHGGTLTTSLRFFYNSLLCSPLRLRRSPCTTFISPWLSGGLCFLLSFIFSFFLTFTPPKLGHPLKSPHSDALSVFLSGRNQRVIYQEVADEISLNCLLGETGQWFLTSVERVFLRNMGQTTLEEELIPGEVGFMEART